MTRESAQARPGQGIGRCHRVIGQPSHGGGALGAGHAAERGRCGIELTRIDHCRLPCDRRILPGEVPDTGSIAVMPACGHGRCDGQHKGHRQTEQPVVGDSGHGVKQSWEPMRARVSHGLENPDNLCPARMLTATYRAYLALDLCATHSLDTWS